jgi:hypothetical protein
MTDTTTFLALAGEHAARATADREPIKVLVEP